MIATHTFPALRPGPRACILCSLLLLAALPGCKRDGLSDYQRELNKKEDAANALRAQGAKVELKEHPKIPRYGSAYAVSLSGAQITDDMFQKLKDLQRVSELDLSKSSITDDQMDKLNEVVPMLLKLDLSNTAVTDAGLEKLTNLNFCYNLNLAGAKVTPAGVARFKQQRLARPTTKFKDMKIQTK